jgi:hypothetical protein
MMTRVGLVRYLKANFSRAGEGNHAEWTQEPEGDISGFSLSVV